MNFDAVEIREMMYVMEIYKTGSFSRAAENCFITQPALSKIIKRTERNLGVEIFNRGTYPLQVTHDGEVVLEYFRNILELYKELNQYCTSVNKQKKSDIRIGAPSFFCAYTLPHVISSFQQEHPQFHVQLIENNDDDLRKSLKAGIVDIGITVEKSMPAEFQSRILFQEKIILAVPRKLPVNEQFRDCCMTYDQILYHDTDADVRHVPIGAFANEKFLVLKKGNDMRRRTMRVCRDAGFEPNIVMELDQLLTAYYLAEAGRGITFIRESLPYYVGETDNLNFYKIDHESLIRDVTVIYNKNQGFSEIQEEFIDHMASIPLPTV